MRLHFGVEGLGSERNTCSQEHPLRLGPCCHAGRMIPGIHPHPLSVLRRAELRVAAARRDAQEAEVQCQRLRDEVDAVEEQLLARCFETGVQGEASPLCRNPCVKRSPRAGFQDTLQ